MYWNENDILMCGDFNEDSGNAQDIEHNDDTSQNRHPVDIVCNKYGDYLIEFLRDSGVIVLPQVLSTTRLVLITSCIDQNLSTIRFAVANYLLLLTYL